MTITRLVLVALLSAFAFSLPASGMGKKKNRTMVSFHLETSADEAPKFAFPHTLPGTNIKRYFKITPEFTNRNIVWYHPFPAQDGRGQGLLFKLDAAATSRLEALSAQNRGKYLVTSLLGTQTAPILIDRPVTDGVIVIWGGVDEAQIAMLSEQVEQYRDPNAPFDPKQKKKKKKSLENPDPASPVLQLPQPAQAAPVPASQPWAGAATPLPQPGTSYPGLPSQQPPASPPSPIEPPLPQPGP
jgi:hypothetical protein